MASTTEQSNSLASHPRFAKKHLKSLTEKTNTYRDKLPKNLLHVPGSYALSQAVEILVNSLEKDELKNKKEIFHYTVNPDLSFPPSDIKAIEVTEDSSGQMQISLMLNLMGLHGAGSPLPAYFTEHVAQHHDEADALRDFFDIFNHRFISLLLESNTKYKYYKRYSAGAVDKISSYFFSFMGQGNLPQRIASNIHWPRLMPFIGLISFNGESAETLERVLQHYFSFPNIRICPCIRRWVTIASDQQSLLGKQNISLGEDFILGASIADINGKFRIHIYDLSWEEFHSFLPSAQNFATLQTLIVFILKSRLAFDIKLGLKSKELKSWKIGSNNSFRLGWSTWIGNVTQGTTILQSSPYKGL